MPSSIHIYKEKSKLLWIVRFSFNSSLIQNVRFILFLHYLINQKWERNVIGMKDLKSFILYALNSYIHPLFPTVLNSEMKNTGVLISSS